MRQIEVSPTGLIVAIVISVILALVFASPINGLLGFKLAAVIGVSFALYRNQKQIKRNKSLNQDAILDIVFGVVGGVIFIFLHGFLWFGKTYIYTLKSGK